MKIKILSSKNFFYVFLFTITDKIKRRKMLNSVDNVSFGSWRTVKMFLPRRIVGYSTHTPKEAARSYGYFMPKEQKQNPIKRFFNRMIEQYKGIHDAMKPEK